MNKRKITGIAMASGLCSFICLAIAWQNRNHVRNWDPSDYLNPLRGVNAAEVEESQDEAPLTDIPFDSREWRCRETNDRLRMVNDLYKGHGLIGMKPKELEKLLGKAKDFRLYFPQYDAVYLVYADRSRKHWEYLAFKYDHGVVKAVCLDSMNVTRKGKAQYN